MTDQAIAAPGKADIASQKPLFKLATELGPLAVFFLANSRGDWLAQRFPFFADLGGPIFIATALFMIATAISLTLSQLILKKIPVMPLVSGVVVMVFGGLTLYLQDDVFIKMKPTIVNLLFASVLLGGLFFGRVLMKLAFGEVIKLREEGWRLLTIRWSLFFIALAILNEIVWRSFDTDTWVQFKVFGIMPITFIFTMSQIGLLQKYQIVEEAAVQAATDSAR